MACTVREKEKNFFTSDHFIWNNTLIIHQHSAVLAALVMTKQSIDAYLEIIVGK